MTSYFANPFEELKPSNEKPSEVNEDVILVQDDTDRKIQIKFNTNGRKVSTDFNSNEEMLKKSSLYPKFLNSVLRHAINFTMSISNTIEYYC